MKNDKIDQARDAVLSWRYLCYWWTISSRTYYLDIFILNLFTGICMCSYHSGQLEEIKFVVYDWNPFPRVGCCALAAFTANVL